MNSVGFIYNEIINNLRQACYDHIKDLISADELQQMVYRAEVAIIALEEKDVRDMMMDTEGKLESIKFTVEEDQQANETRKVAEKLLSWLDNRERGIVS